MWGPMAMPMPNDTLSKWVISSSGQNMFVYFTLPKLAHSGKPGFIAKIHYGNEINDSIKELYIHQISDLFSVNCATVINGEIGLCACHSCSELEGDCDFDHQCQEGLSCGSNNCPTSFGFDAHTDCCYKAVVGTEDFCSTDQPCKVDEGHCDSDDECESHLFCGSNNCPDSLGFLPSVDCCEPKGNTT